MNLVGDADGIAALKQMKEGKRDYLKFLIKEAQTVFEQQVEFKDEGGVKYLLKFDKPSGEFRVEKL